MSDDLEIGKVKIVGSRYKLEGKFHHIEKNQPILDEEGRLGGITNPRNMTYIHTYGGESIFFESLGKGKLLASRCDNPDCESHGMLSIPYRIHCPDCLYKNSPFDITDKAKENKVQQ